MPSYLTVLNTMSPISLFDFTSKDGANKTYDSINQSSYATVDVVDANIEAQSLVSTEDSSSTCLQTTTQYNSTEVTGAVDAIIGRSFSFLFAVDDFSSLDETDDHRIVSTHSYFNRTSALYLHKDSSTGVVSLRAQNYSGQYEGVIIGNITLGKVYHLVCASDGAKISKLYIDGVEVSSGVTFGTLKLQYFLEHGVGRIDKVAVHDITLTAQQVSELYSAASLSDVSITGTVTDTIPADQFEVVAHRTDNNFVTGKQTVTNGTFSMVVPNVPHYVVVIPYQGERYVTGEAYSLDDLVFPNDMQSTPYYFKCTTAGTAGTNEPSWNTADGDTTNDGTVVWTLVGRLYEPITHSPMLPSQTV